MKEVNEQDTISLCMALIPLIKARTSRTDSTNLGQNRLSPLTRLPSPPASIANKANLSPELLRMITCFGPETWLRQNDFVLWGETGIMCLTSGKTEVNELGIGFRGVQRSRYYLVLRETVWHCCTQILLTNSFGKNYLGWNFKAKYWTLKRLGKNIATGQISALARQRGRSCSLRTLRKRERKGQKERKPEGKEARKWQMTGRIDL